MSAFVSVGVFGATVFSVTMMCTSAVSAFTLTDTIGGTDLFHDPYIAFMDYDEHNAPWWFGADTQGRRSFTVFHDLADYGFSDAYDVVSASLTLSFADDFGWFCGVDCGREYANVTFTGFDSIWEIDGIPNLALSDVFFDVREIGLGVDGLIDLNADGVLAVTINALDAGSKDFYWVRSVLSAEINEVSEPSPWVLFGLGVVGMVVIRRRIHHRNDNTHKK